MRIGAAVLLVGCLTLLSPAFALADPPANDNRADARDLGALPTRVTDSTAEATLEPTEPGSRCQASKASVWYRFRADDERRVVVNLAAAGDLDAVVDVYRRVRSQTEQIDCDTTDANGQGAVAFRTEKDGDYLIRVAELTNSVSGTFTLDVFVPEPPASPPGAALPPLGAVGSIDRVFNPSDAYSFVMREGVSYRINLAVTECVNLALYSPRTRSFETRPAAGRTCGGYLVYTPGAGRGGRYTLLVSTASSRQRGEMRYRLQAGEAGRDDTAPGVFVRNYQRSQARLNGRRLDLVDLYRFDVLRRSELELRLATSDRNGFDLQLLDEAGRRLGCACGDTGSVSIRGRIKKGRYFAAVRVRGVSAGRYAFTRITRTITSTRTTFNGLRNAGSGPGRTARLTVNVSPRVSGPVTVIVDRFDPLGRWQFLRRYRVFVVNGRATIAFTPPSVGRFRASSQFRGTRVAAASASGFAKLRVVAPLRD